MFVELCRFALLSHLVIILWSQCLVACGSKPDDQDSPFNARVLLSSNPVYSGEPVTLTCSYGEGKALSEVSVDAFNGTHRQGSLSCHGPRNSTVGLGVFDGSKFIGCPIFLGGSTNVSVIMTAASSLELQYNCTAVVVADIKEVLASAATHLSVSVLPSIPQFISSPIILNNNDTATIICESSGGKPTAAINVTVINSNQKFATTSGNGTALLALPSPLMDWHNATVECTVTNHNFSNMTVLSDISINYISQTYDPSAACVSTDRPLPTCSSFVSSSPAVSHVMPVLSEANHSDPLRREFGLINCILTENNRVKRVVVFVVSTCLFVVSPEFRQYFNCMENQATCYAIGFSAGIIILGVAALVVLGTKGFLSTGRTLPLGSEMRLTGGDIFDAKAQTEDRHYQTLTSQQITESPYTQLVGTTNESCAVYADIPSDDRQCESLMPHAVHEPSCTQPIRGDAFEAKAQTEDGHYEPLVSQITESPYTLLIGVTNSSNSFDADIQSDDRQCKSLLHNPFNKPS